jgi:hypothetical protein
MEKKIIASDRVKDLNEIILSLQRSLPVVMSSPPLWRDKIGIDEKITYLKELAAHKSALWKTIAAEHPETVGRNVSVNSIEITYELPDPTPPEPANLPS